MKVGVSIDGVLRNFLGKVQETHEKYFPLEEDKEPVQVLDYDLDKWLEFPEEENKQGELEFNPEFNESTFMDGEQTIELTKVNNKVTVDEFLYERCTLEIFGYANEVVSSAVETLNNLVLDNPQHEFIIISREGGLALPSTLFFLSKTKSLCPNIKFVTEYSKVWDYVDVMITDHPKILESKPVDKFSIIIDKEYNKDFNHSGMRIKTIKEIDNNIIKSLENNIEFIKTDWTL